MKRLVFDCIVLLSSQTRSARRIHFHPQVTIIKGENLTGKSALVKSIYAALGADPRQFPVGWTDLDVRTLLKFRIDGQAFAMLRDAQGFTLFGESEQVIGVYRDIARDLAPKLAELMDFRLELPSSAGDPKTPIPAYLFAPFYIDQDIGWKNPWGSFARLKRNVRKDTLEYHVGIKPNEYYAIKAEMRDLQSKEVKPRMRYDLLLQMVADIDQKLVNVDFSFDIDIFQAEIGRLLALCNQLRQKQAGIREKVIELQNHRLSLANQIRIVRRAASELGRDFNYATHLNAATVQCPTCGAEYDNGFAGRFDIARDEDRCVDLEGEMQTEMKETESELTEQQQLLGQAGKELAEIGTILDTRRGEVSLRELLQRAGTREIRTSVNDDMELVKLELDDLNRQIRQCKRSMKKFVDGKLRKTIMAEYSRLMHDHAGRLEVLNLPAYAFTKIDADIMVSGSPEPRALQTYFLAILDLIAKHSSAVFCPVVVDSVNNNEQDPSNLARMLGAFRDHLPSDTQLILASVDTGSVKFGGSVVELTEQHSLLRTAEYADCAQVIRPLIDKREQFMRMENES